MGFGCLLSGLLGRGFGPVPLVLHAGWRCASASASVSACAGGVPPRLGSGPVRSVRLPRVAGPWVGPGGVRRGCGGGPQGNPGGCGEGCPCGSPARAGGPMSVDLAGAGASCLCDGFGLRRFGSSPAGCLPVPRFRWLVFGSSLAGCLPVPPEGFDLDLDLDLDFDLPSAPFLTSPSGSPWGGGEVRNGADGSARRADAGRRGPGDCGSRTAPARRVAGLCGCCVAAVPGCRGVRGLVARLIGRGLVVVLGPAGRQVWAG
jgi:hypothetical protein